MGSAETLTEWVGRLTELCDEIRARRRPFATLGDAGMGYEWTPLERELGECTRALGAALQSDPRVLSGALLARIVAAIPNCSAAIAKDRVRLIAVAGDYGDITSPVTGLMVALIAALRVKRLSWQGVTPLDEVDNQLLERAFGVYEELAVDLTVLETKSMGEWLDVRLAE